ncbi:MAG: ABC transporter ATP-binding protein [Rhizobiales bacterium]|nr:ABC transporter ATP-binding protein [Hyphomicrobiales bacterium]
MIDLKNVSLTLGSGARQVEILRGLDLQVKSGEAVALIGPSGSGKSTLLSVTGGLERPDQGQVMIAGHDITSLSEDELALFRRDNIGIVFQSFHLIPNMTALENVAVPLEFAGRADAFARAADMLARVGLGDRTGHYPTELSGGEQQRVALSRALAIEPHLLLADEPTGNLDAVTGADIVELIFELREEHDTSLVLVTHDPTLAARCDRVFALQEGRAVLQKKSRAARRPVKAS